MAAVRTAREFTVALLTLGAVVFSGLSLGLHSGTDIVGQAPLRPTTVYFSQHTADGDQEHLHAETGFESVLCLACFVSVRNQTVLEGSPALLALTAARERPPAGHSQAPIDPPENAPSSRAPPSV